MTKTLGDAPKARNRTGAPCSHVDRQYSEWAGCPICGVRELNFGQGDKVASSNDLTCGGTAAKKDKYYQTLCNALRIGNRRGRGIIRMAREGNYAVSIVRKVDGR